MHNVLAGGHDQVVLQAALQRLQQPQIACLIAYLLKWVSRQPGENPGACPGTLRSDIKAVNTLYTELWNHFVSLS